MANLRMAVISVLAAAMCGAADAGTAERGGELVERYCGRCHAVGREGASPEPAAPAFRDLHRRYDPEQLSEALAEGLLTGHPLMPEFRFEPDDVRSIILYLKSIQTRQTGRGPDAPKGDEPPAAGVPAF